MSSSNPKQPLRTTWLTRFARGFSPSRWLRASEGLQRLSEGGGGQEWILARAFCAYTVLDGVAVPPRKRRAFAEMSVARWAPFADVQSHVEWVGDKAMVWAWSRSRVLAGEDGEPLPPPRRILPESLLRGAPQEHGEALAAMADGCEGRVWRDGVMQVSRWWPAAPELHEWNEFRRGAGLSPAATVPELQALPLGERTWSAQRRVDFGDALGQYRNYLVAGAAGLAAAVFSALLVGAFALKASIWQVERDIADREKALEKIINARDAALQAQGAITQALALRPPAGQLELLSLMPRLFRGNWQLVEWKMPDAQTLEVTARMANPDPRAIVSAWEDSKRFAEVTAQLGRQADTVVVKARVLRGSAGGKP